MRTTPKHCLFLARQHNLLPQPPRSKYIHPDDELVLEDELQRIRLEGTIDVSRLVTGRQGLGSHLALVSQRRPGYGSGQAEANQQVWPTGSGKTAASAPTGLTFCSLGTVLAVLGSVRDDGKFMVEEHCFAELPPQKPTAPLDSDR